MLELSNNWQTASTALLESPETTSSLYRSRIAAACVVCAPASCSPCSILCSAVRPLRLVLCRHLCSSRNQVWVGLANRGTGFCVRLSDSSRVNLRDSLTVELGMYFALTETALGRGPPPLALLSGTVQSLGSRRAATLMPAASQLPHLAASPQLPRALVGGGLERRAFVVTRSSSYIFEVPLSQVSTANCPAVSPRRPWPSATAGSSFSMSVAWLILTSSSFFCARTALASEEFPSHQRRNSDTSTVPGPTTRYVINM